MNLLSKSKSFFVKLLVGNDMLALNATHTMNGRRHTVLAKFKVNLLKFAFRVSEIIIFLLFYRTL